VGPTPPPVQWVPRLSRGKERPGREADPSPLLVPRSRKRRAIPLLPLWAVGLYRASVPVQGCTLPYFTNYVDVWPPCLSATIFRPGTII